MPVRPIDLAGVCSLRAALAQIGERRSDRSTKQVINLRQELGKVEFGRAHSTGGF
jgi:hypothetical protein